MLFQRFLKRRKQAANKTEPATKPAAHPKHQEALSEQALHHAEASQRRGAIAQLDSPEILHRILTQDQDTGVREAATARYLTLLCGAHSAESEPEPWLATLSQIQDATVLEQIALRGQLPDIRRSAIERVHSPKVLADCAVEDSLAGNRALAVERLEDKSALEAVVRGIGKRDKRVYRIAREKLRLIAEQEALPSRIRAQCEEICAKTERLGRLGNWTQDRALLEHLERQWSAIEAQAQPEWQRLFQSERVRFLAAYDAHCRANEAQLAEQANQEATQVDAESLLAALSALRDPPDPSTLGAECERIAAAWARLPALPPSRRQPLDKRYHELMREIGAAREALANQREQTERLGKLTAKVERLLAESKPTDLKKAKNFLDQGRELAPRLPDSAVTQTFQALAERLETRLRTQRKHAEQRLQQFAERLAELEGYLAAGELKKADPLYQSLLSGLDLIQASAIRANEAAELDRRLRALAPRLRELQHWRRWGADQHRDTLCVEVEGLIEADLPLGVLADRLHALQMDWKGLDKSGSPANQALWDRFHNACEAVYARCRPYMEGQAAEREANRIARERVCKQLEEFLSKVDWERVEWRKILRAEREIRQTWSSIGATEGRARKHLERRFHESIKQLDQRLDAERKRNQAHKQQLIERVEALVGLPDLDVAIEQTKALQREWQTTVPARQKDENKLWQQFRAACDAVFERRAALQQAHANELKENLKIRETICEEAETLASAEQDPKRLVAARRELRERWNAAESLPVPRPSASALAQRWQRARETLERREHAAEERRRVAALELLKRQAELCQRLELGLLGETPDPLDPESARHAWAKLPAQTDSGLQQAMETRLERALTAAQDPALQQEMKQHLSANDALLRQMCLQLEIIASVESPPELAQQRLELQVARLAERMVEGEEDPLQGAGRLLYDWYLCGPAPRNEALLARFERARQVLLPDPAGPAEISS